MERRTSRRTERAREREKSLGYNKGDEDDWMEVEDKDDAIEDKDHK